MIDEKRSETLLLERTLQRLFGETSYHVEKTPCRGKFRGHNDYSIVFGSGRKLFIGQDQRNYLNDLETDWSDPAFPGPPGREHREDQSRACRPRHSIL